MAVWRIPRWRRGSPAFLPTSQPKGARAHQLSSTGAFRDVARPKCPVPASHNAPVGWRHPDGLSKYRRVENEVGGGRVGEAAERRRRFASLSGRLALLDDPSLAALVPSSGRSGWGVSSAAMLGDDPVFVKRIPVTSLEAAHRHSTRNRFQLPTVYNYGVGSAGFGAYREFATHVKTTGWVLADESDGFPMLLHARLLPRRAAAADGWIGSADYVHYWNGSKRIGNFIRARAAATEELCLVLEHVPHTLRGWLLEHQADVPAAVGQLCDTLTFLHGRGVLHLDAHFSNAVTDGARVYLADYGLALDAAFELTTREQDFFRAHQHYDFGEAIANVGALLLPLVQRTTKRNQRAIAKLLGTPPDSYPIEALAASVERLVEQGLLDLHPALLGTIVQYRGVIDFMWRFFGAMWSNPRKDTPFDDALLWRLIVDAGGLPRGQEFSL